MRLIDADYLKNLPFERLIHTDYGETAIPIEEIDNVPTVEPKLKDSIIEAFNQITDQEFEHSDSFWIVTPKGKKIEFEKKRPQGECEKCTYRIFTEKFADSISEVMALYGITSIEEFQERLQAEMRGKEE